MANGNLNEKQIQQLKTAFKQLSLEQLSELEKAECKLAKNSLNTEKCSFLSQVLIAAHFQMMPDELQRRMEAVGIQPDAVLAFPKNGSVDPESITPAYRSSRLAYFRAVLLILPEKIASGEF